MLCFVLNDTATTEIYPLSLHDALPIYRRERNKMDGAGFTSDRGEVRSRSEEHTSELQSLRHLVCRLLLEKTNAHQLGVADLLVALRVLAHQTPEVVLLCVQPASPQWLTEWSPAVAAVLPAFFFLKDGAPPSIPPFPPHDPLHT